MKPHSDSGFAKRFSSAVAEGGSARRVRERKDIEPRYLWKTEAIFADRAAWDAEYAAVDALVERIPSFQNTLGNGPEALLAALKHFENAGARLERVMVYASLLSDQDTRVGEHQEMDTRGKMLAVKYGELSSWFEPELIGVPFETLEDWMVQNEDLRVYAQYFDSLQRRKEYILSAREEELLAMAGEVRRTPYEAYNLLSNADLQFPTVKGADGSDMELSDGSFYVFMRDGDRAFRERAYRGIVGAYQGMRNTTAALLNGMVQNHILEVRARGYESCLAAALHGSNIPVEVYTTLVTTVNKHLPLLHRYVKLKRTSQKLDKVKAWDLFVPLVSGTKIDVTYEQAIDMIGQALEPLGAEYLTPMKEGFASRWVDVYETKGKRSGAYSSGTFLTDPYILMNFHGGYDDMSTLAHEMGHSMHSWFSRGAQPYIYSDYDIFCAEVASTFNEILLDGHVLANTDDPHRKLYLLSEFLEGIRGTVFRQTMFSEYEQKIHELAEQGQPLTADVLSAAYGEINRRYNGPEYEHDELVDNYWIRIPHFYYNFYVYKYATSYCAASNIARRIRDGEDGAVAAYLGFLKSGSSKYPLDLLAGAGVDMTSPQPIEDAMGIFEEMLTQAEGLDSQLSS